MYNQGNYQQFGQRLPAPPPPPPPPFQQGSPAPQYPIGQQGRPPIPPHVGQGGPSAYAHASASMQLVPPVSVPPSGTFSSSQSYLVTPPPPPTHVHGSTSTPHSYSTPPQNSNWTPTAHQISPAVPPPLGHHLAPRIPAPQPQGQPFYRGPAPPLPHGGIQGLQQAPPPPPTSSYFTPAPFGSFVEPTHESTLGNLPPLPPPPPPPPPPSSPPPGPPPLPPSSPLGDSSLHPSSALSFCADGLDPSSRKSSDIDMVAAGVFDEVFDTHHSSNDACGHDDSLNLRGDTGFRLSVEHSSDLSNLSPAPPKPTEEKTVRKIEVLCQYIAKNGHEFEDMTRQKEVGNPEFKFLFGGEQGSEAAVANEYFKWMKKKCSLICELPEGRQQNYSTLRAPGVGLSPLNDATKHVGVSHSPADSDMDMEDDITQPDEPGTGKSLASTNNRAVSISTGVELAEEQIAAKRLLDKDVTDGNSGYARLLEQGGILTQDGIQVERSVKKGGNAVPECPSNCKADNISPDSEMNRSSDSAAVEVSSSQIPDDELVKGTSPFRLIQDYASDDSTENDDEPHREDVSPGAVSPSFQAETTSLHGLQTDIGSKDSSELGRGLGSLSVDTEKVSFGKSSKIPDPSAERKGLEKKTDTHYVKGKDGQLDKSHGNRVFVDGAPQIAYKQKNGLDVVGADAGSKSGKFEKEYNSELKVDEFGRLAKASASDSDSDDLHYTRRRGKRGRSQSRSPYERRRRSPWRRREKRSPSCSWSPKRRRSRSKSPLYRHGVEASGERIRRDRSQQPICLDFQRGKCFRGTSCRYFHDAGKDDESRRYKYKQQYEELPHRLKKSDKSVHEHAEVNVQEIQTDRDVHRSSSRVKKGGDIYREEIIDSSQTSCLPEKDADSLVTNVGQGVTGQVRDGKEEFEEPACHLAESASSLETGNAIQLVGNASAPPVTVAGGLRLPFIRNSIGQQTHASLLDPLLYSGEQLQLNKDSSSSGLAALQVQAVPAQYSIEERPLNQISPAQLQLPPPSLLQSTHAQFPSRLPREYNLLPTTANYPLHSSSLGNYPSYQPPLPFENSQISVPPASAWNSLPNPPPHPPNGVPLPQFQQNQLPPQSNYPSQTFVPFVAELPTHLQAGEMHKGAYPSVLDSHQPLSHTEDFRPGTFPGSHLMTQQLGGPRLYGEDNFTRLPGQSMLSSNSFAQGNVHSQSPQFSSESPKGRMQPFSGENLPPAGPSTYSLLKPVADSISTLGETGKMNLRYASDFPERTQLPSLSDFGGSRISSHYNPYASTFDQPLSTKFSSGVLSLDKGTSYSDKYGGTFGQSHVPVDGQGIGSRDSRNMESSSTSGRDVTRSLPRPGGDQYDPLFDSIEPSSNSFRKSDHGKQNEGTDSDILLRLSGSNMPLDMEENSKHKEAAAAASISTENDEFGETADAEVGAVENDSPSSPIDLPDVATGEIEIDQVKSSGKTKKSKDSRSMKLFKVALADFVKEVLKPSWRQGNMSKEAFKTIVKKTVDKVSGAMKKHHLPKSQVKINQYIDSSQRKLTKLVMGYVDKYVKV